MTIAAAGLTPLIQVYDMPEAIRFYREKLGFEVVATSPEVQTPEGRFSHWALLRLGCAELMLNTAYDAGERPSLPDAGRWNGHGDTCLYFACTDVDSAWRELSEKGLELEPPQTSQYGMRQLYLADPDGYTLCFQARVAQ